MANETGTEGRQTGGPAGRHKRKSWIAIISASLIGFLAGGLLTLLLMTVSEQASSYGTWLFVLVPFATGYVAGMVLAEMEERPAESYWLAGLLCFVWACLGMLVSMQEGLVCLLMASIIVVPMIVGGAFFARYLRNRKSSKRLYFSFLATLPLTAIYTALQIPDSEVRVETTEVTIHASPDRIWPYLFKLDALPLPQNALFKAGIAYPVSTRSEGEFVGAARKCVLSTGVMPERITALEKNRRLAFHVIDTPVCMREMNPFGEVHAPHLKGYYRCLEGEFRLIPLGNGWTRLEGTSQYAFNIYPAPYWALWTDHIVESVHLRVMNEIKKRSESP